jgi:ribonucleoside-diphosphate reductase alpha chain
MIYNYDEAYKASVEYFDGDDLAAKAFLDKYALRNNQGDLVEQTPTDMHRRMAKALSVYELKKYGQSGLTEDQIFAYFDKFKYLIPQGSIMFGLGNTYQVVTLSNCYVVPDPIDSYGGILKTDEQIAQISKRRGGVGTGLDNLRPNGTPTKNSSRTSTGIVTFAERYSHTIREVGQNGRRGALMLTLNVHHPQILDFVQSKIDLTKVTGANISVKLTDVFLNATENNGNLILKWPLDAADPKIVGVMPAKDVWDIIIKTAHATAEPGLLFWDTILRESPADCYPQFKSVSTNPCLIYWTRKRANCWKPVKISNPQHNLKR